MIKGIPHALLASAITMITLAGNGVDFHTIVAIDLGMSVFIIGYLNASNKNNKASAGILIDDRENSSHSDN